MSELFELSGHGPWKNRVSTLQLGKPFFQLFSYSVYAQYLHAQTEAGSDPSESKGSIRRPRPSIYWPSTESGERRGGRENWLPLTPRTLGNLETHAHRDVDMGSLNPGDDRT